MFNKLCMNTNSINLDNDIESSKDMLYHCTDYVGS